MAPYLEMLPQEILQYIALLLAISALGSVHPLRDVLNFAKTSPGLSRRLSILYNPQLYASIFRETFDINSRWHSDLSGSALATELLLRHRLLGCVRRRELTVLTRDELLVALRIILEDQGRNRQHLQAVGFLKFILTFFGSRSNIDNAEVYTLRIWLLCFLLTHRDIAEMPFAQRVGIRRTLQLPPPLPGASPLISGSHSQDRITAILNSMAMSATIIITFALNEAQPLPIPPHTLPSREIANAAQMHGPTIEDFRAIANRRTPLFADVRREMESAASLMGYRPYNPSTIFDQDLCQFLYDNYSVPGRTLTTGGYYGPGTFAGVWEGTFMISAPVLSGSIMHIQQPSTDVLRHLRCIKPMQCAFSEYFCFSPHLPIPLDYPCDQLENAIHSRKFEYQKYIPEFKSCGLQNPRDPHSALDVVLIGETLPGHEEAWGGVKFAGRIRADGCLSLYRRPKDPRDMDSMSLWMMEGRLRYSSALVGHFRYSSSTDIFGIFSLCKKRISIVL